MFIFVTQSFAQENKQIMNNWYYDYSTINYHADTLQWQSFITMDSITDKMRYRKSGPHYQTLNLTEDMCFSMKSVHSRILPACGFAITTYTQSGKWEIYTDTLVLNVEKVISTHSEGHGPTTHEQNTKNTLKYKYKIENGKLLIRSIQNNKERIVFPLF